VSYPAPTVTIASKTISEIQNPQKIPGGHAPHGYSLHEVHWNLRLYMAAINIYSPTYSCPHFFFLMLYTQWIYSVFGDLLLLCNNRDGDISCSSEAQAQVLVSEVVCDEIDMM